MSEGNFYDSGEAWQQASSDDYLEKIFQIPFRIGPLGDIARQQFVGALVNERFPTGWNSPTDDDYSIPAIELNPREASLYDEETACIIELHVCLGRSPRRVKRFVNVYRLMRAGMAPGDAESIISRKHYRHILALFALLTGSARLGPLLMEELHRALNNGKSIRTSNWLSAWLDGFPELDRYDAEEVASARIVLSYLDNLDDKAELADTLAEWIPSVRRFCFREVRVDPA